LVLGNDDTGICAAQTQATSQLTAIDTASSTVAESVSSNKFANGANQNCGNSITDRPATRVHQAPGGASTVCLGCD